MSAESEMTNILNHAGVDASSLASAASAAVRRAVTLIDQEPEWADFTAWTPQDVGMSDGSDQTPLDLVSLREREREAAARRDPNTDGAFRFPTYPLIKPLSFPALRAAVTLKPTALPPAPTLNVPGPRVFAPAVVPPFTGQAPSDPTTDTPLPPFPDTAMPDGPEFLPFADLDIPELRLPYLELLPPPPPLPLPVHLVKDTMGGIQDLIFDGEGGLSALIREFRKRTQEANLFLPLVLGASGVNPLLAGNGLTTAVTDALDRIRRMLARLDTWPLPAASKAALDAEVTRLTTRWRALASGTVAASGQAKALDYQAAARDALTGFAKKAHSLYGLEIDLALKAHAFAGRYAKRMIGVLLDVHDVLHYEQYDADVRYAEAALAGHEAQLTVALLELDLAEARLEREKSLQSRNSDAIQRYAADAEESRRQVAVYAAHVGAARKERDFKRLPYDTWALQLKAAGQLTEADIAYAELAQAELAGDKALLAATDAKIRLYQEQARAFEQASTTQRQAVAAAEINNDAVIAEYRAALKTTLLQREQDVAKTEYTIDQRIALLERYLDQARVDAQRLQATRDFEEKRTEGEVKAREIAVDRINALVDTEAERLRGMAELHLTGSEITGRMAQGVASQVTRLATGLISQ